MGTKGSELAVYQRPDDVRRDLESIQSQLMEVLPSRVDADRFIRVTAKAIISNPTLMSCTRLSLLSSIHTAAQLGLEPSGLLGSAYLVPYKVKGVMQAQLIPGYRGLIDLARRSGEILKVEARTVRQRDRFLIDYGAPQPVQHVPFIPNPTDAPEDRDPGPYVGAYMRAILRDDPIPQVEWMTTDEIEAVRRRSKAADQGPWVTDWSEMARKTVVRRGSKYLPMTTDFRAALELDEEAERAAERPTVTQPTNKATAMLLERAAATRGTGSDAPETPEGVEEPEPDDDEAPGPSETFPTKDLPNGTRVIDLPAPEEPKSKRRQGTDDPDER